MDVRRFHAIALPSKGVVFQQSAEKWEPQLPLAQACSSSFHSAHEYGSSGRATVADAAVIEGEQGDKVCGFAETPASLKCDAWKHFGFPPRKDIRRRCWTRTDTQLSFNKCTALIFCIAAYSKWKERNSERNLAKTNRQTKKSKTVVCLKPQVSLSQFHELVFFLYIAHGSGHSCVSVCHVCEQ